MSGEPTPSPAKALPPTGETTAANLASGAGVSFLPASCDGCGAEIDRLRAGHVAFFHEQFAYFCDLVCRARALGRRDRLEQLEQSRALVEAVQSVSPLPRAELDEPRDFSPSPSPSLSPPLSLSPSPSPSRQSSPVPPREPEAASWRGATSTPTAPAEGMLDGALEAPAQDPRPTEDDDEPPTDLEGLLLVGSGSLAALSLGLALLGDGPTIEWSRAIAVLAGALVLAGRAFTASRDAADAHPLAVVASPTLAGVLALVTCALGDPAAGLAATTSGLLVLVGAALALLRRYAKGESDHERDWVALALSQPGRRVGRDDVTIVAAHELRPGETIECVAGDVVPADLVIERGKADVFPWLGATVASPRGKGDAVVAGARLARGTLTGIVGWTGGDRSWARLLLDEERRVDVAAFLPRMARSAAEIWALAAAALAGVALFANGARPAEILLAALACHGALATTTVASVPGLHMMRGVLAAARRGIAYRTADAWDSAGRVTATVFAARGTLLLGEPEVVEVEPMGKVAPGQLLSWVAGAEGGDTHPVARATRRAARQHGVAVDAVRSPHAMPGLGVTAVTSGGEALLVGSRALMLEQRVSIALAESRVAELEALGRTVLLVSVAQRLVGWVALQDGLRPGARAAVQHLLDVDVEPILLTGESRETCETLARSLDIDHVRPEVLPPDRPGEIRRIAEAGARVAVIGRPETDAGMLGAADVSVALRAAGSSPNDWSISLAGDDARDAALAVTIAHRTAREARVGLALTVAPGIFAALTVALGLLPPLFAPLAALAGGAVAILHARAAFGAKREPSATPWDLTLPSVLPKQPGEASRPRD